MCYNLAPIRLQDLPERCQTLPPDCLHHCGFSVGVYSLKLRLTQAHTSQRGYFPNSWGYGSWAPGLSTHRWACVPHDWGPNLLRVPAVQIGSLRCPADVCRHEETLHGA